jgi:alanyl-tRNA synthetase
VLLAARSALTRRAPQINGLEVVDVQKRKDGVVVHKVRAAELAVGASVQLHVDWQRRFDHMQQHSGQHLITAIADKEFGWKTVSWSLGPERSYIEMDTPAISPEQLSQLETRVNQEIIAQVGALAHGPEVARALNQYPLASGRRALLYTGCSGTGECAQPRLA